MRIANTSEMISAVQEAFSWRRPAVSGLKGRETTDNVGATYFEWMKSVPKRTDIKQRYEIAPNDGGTIAFAGLYRPWRNREVEDLESPDA